MFGRFNVPLAASSIIFAMIAGGMQYFVLKTGPTLNTNPRMSIVQYVLPVMIMIFGLMAPTAITLYCQQSHFNPTEYLSIQNSLS